MPESIFDVLYMSIMGLTRCYKTTVFTFIVAVFVLNLFHSRNGEEGQSASLCQISSKSLQPRRRYGDFAVLNDRVREADRECVRPKWWCPTFAGSRPTFIVSVFVRELLAASSGRKSLTFQQILIKMFIFRTQHIPFHRIIMHEVTRWSERCSVMQLWRHQSVKKSYCVFFPVSIDTKNVKIHQELQMLYYWDINPLFAVCMLIICILFIPICVIFFSRTSCLLLSLVYDE